MTKRICISGAGSGIGRAIALRLAQDDSELVLIGRRLEPLEAVAREIAQFSTNQVEVAAADLSNEDEVPGVLGVIAEKPFDAVIANAGGNEALNDEGPQGDGWRRRSWEWSANFRSNVLTAVHLVEGLREHEAINRDASIVLLSSIAAYRGSGSGSYGGSKSALHPYAVDLGRSLGPSGVTANVVAPGFIDNTEFFRGQLSDSRRRSLRSQTMNGRAGEPDDVASAVAWLCSPSARHVSGQVLQINGGANPGL